MSISITAPGALGLDLSNGGAVALLEPLGVAIPNHDPQKLSPGKLAAAIDQLLARPSEEIAKVRADLEERGLGLDTYDDLRRICEAAKARHTKVRLS